MHGERSSRPEKSPIGRSEEVVFKQGQTPGPGEYRCVTCNEDWQVTLDEEKSRLPPCGRCGPGVTAEYERIGKPESDLSSKSGRKGEERRSRL